MGTPGRSEFAFLNSEVLHFLALAFQPFGPSYLEIFLKSPQKHGTHFETATFWELLGFQREGAISCYTHTGVTHDCSVSSRLGDRETAQSVPLAKYEELTLCCNTGSLTPLLWEGEETNIYRAPTVCQVLPFSHLPDIAGITCKILQMKKMMCRELPKLPLRAKKGQI